MKKLILLYIFVSTTNGSFSQTIDPKGSVQNGASNRANSRLDQGVDKGLDKVENGIGSLFRKKHKKTDSAAAAAQPGKAITADKVVTADKAETSDAQSIVGITPAGVTLQDLYLSLEVESNWLAGHHVNWETGQPDMPGSEHGNKTHCSAFAAAACKKVGVYLLSPPEHGQLLLANAQYDWLSTPAAVKAGWRPITGNDRYKQVQTLANSGKIVIAICRNPDPHEPGHAALVMPKERTLNLLESEGPEVIMAGTHNHNFISLKNGFHSHLTEWPEQEVRFYVQENPLRQMAQTSSDSK